MNAGVLKALNPAVALACFVQHKTLPFAALGMVIVAVTGAEALYADM
ncbi:potassium transporter [Brenneria salicis ATCC 15712 = DSM 30166]|uniref:Potassium transporter n=1 Tax=Brenneria salicis ATCC 15712 = DSM 30166 TaxID=714314 RepID=A0A366I562_9GAMM|nr:potassium transporter [Brenneria salicis ATCC 15712 = DSM 30166]